MIRYALALSVGVLLAGCYPVVDSPVSPALLPAPASPACDSEAECFEPACETEADCYQPPTTLPACGTEAECNASEAAAS